MRRTLLALFLLALPILPPGPAAAVPPATKATLERRDRILAAIEYLLGEVERHAADD